MQEFWERMAKNYPRWDEVNLKRDVDFVLGWLEKNGVEFEKKSVLDVGCGTGAMSIPLAKLRANVCAIDPTNGMLDVLREDSEGLEIIQCDMYGLEKRVFDIVVTSLTPAISSKEDLEKFISLSRDICIYVGWGKYRDNSLHVELLDLLGLERKSTSDAFRVSEFSSLVEALGYVSHVEYFEAGWTKLLEYDDAFTHLGSLLKKDGFEVNEEAIREVLANNMQDKKVVSVTKAQKGVCFFSKVSM